MIVCMCIIISSSPPGALPPHHDRPGAASRLATSLNRNILQTSGRRTIEWACKQWQCGASYRCADDGQSSEPQVEAASAPKQAGRPSHLLGKSGARVRRVPIITILTISITTVTTSITITIMCVTIATSITIRITTITTIAHYYYLLLLWKPPRRTRRRRCACRSSPPRRPKVLWNLIVLLIVWLLLYSYCF